MEMTIEDCTKMLIAKEKCMERETSGTDTDCNSHNCDNCSLCYEQGTMGEQKMALFFAVDAMRQYQQLQADYEARLKADLKAILVELQLEIKELWDNRYDVWLDNQYYIGKSDTLEEVGEIIQQKIDALKENSHDD